MKYLTITTSFSVSVYEKSWDFSITLFKQDAHIKYTAWLPRVNECDWSYWACSWLIFSIYIDKKGSAK